MKTSIRRKLEALFAANIGADSQAELDHMASEDMLVLLLEEAFDQLESDREHSHFIS